MNSWKTQLIQTCPDTTFRENESLAHHTTVGIGGPAELFCIVTSKDECTKVLQAAVGLKIPTTVLGWGANTLIADRGIAGLVIKNTASEIRVLTEQPTASSATAIDARWKAATSDSRMPQFQDIDYDENDAERVVVDVDAGAALPVLIQQLVQRGITGLQWFTKIPASLGGAVVNNIHGGTHYISEFIASVTVLDASGTTQTLSADQLEFGYDYSRFHHSNEFILSVRLQLFRGDQQRAQQVITDWSRQKQKQPARSLGCVFQNISVEEQAQLSLPTPSIGYLVDQKLHLAGLRIGDAEISQQHAAFIVNTGAATATDYLELLKRIHAAVKVKFGISLKPEIFFKGFKPEELAFITQL
ncbi:MAG: FAD-binding protein [Candidatus Pacebacteria bacterium]|nr:FAD-binding protein [Candidatus Paceibacterota bacterium]